MRNRRQTLVWLLVAGLVVALDHISKLVVEHLLPLGASVPVLAVLDLVHVRNSGAAFSFLASASGWQRELFIVIGMAASGWIVWMLARAGADQKRFCAALSFVLGGAVGNIIDRIRLGGVTDFLHFHLGPYYWPAFNVADSAITCGALLLIWDAMRPSPASRDKAQGH